MWRCIHAGQKSTRSAKPVLLKVVYAFYKGQFYTVHIQFHGLGNKLPIHEALTQTFGPGLISNPYSEHYSWGTTTSVFIYLQYSEVTTDGDVLFQYLPIVRQEPRADLQQKGKAAGNIFSNLIWPGRGSWNTPKPWPSPKVHTVTRIVTLKTKGPSHENAPGR